MMKLAIIAFIFLVIFLTVYLTITYWVHKNKNPKEEKPCCSAAKDDVKQPTTETK